jgi:hypothetical protein
VDRTADADTITATNGDSRPYFCATASTDAFTNNDPAANFNALPYQHTAAGGDAIANRYPAARGVHAKFHITADGDGLAHQDPAACCHAANQHPDQYPGALSA